MVNTSSKKILITTPDYFPKIGGLTTFTDNLFKTLSPHYHVDILHWKSYKELCKLQPGHYDVAFHVHFLGGHILEKYSKVNINFFHGSEILFTSPNFFKRLYKKLFKKKLLQYLERSFFNLSISSVTRDRIWQQGLRPDYSRDIVFHNCIDTEMANFFINTLDNTPIRFSCVARDVPHKNIDGAIFFAKNLCAKMKMKGELYLNVNRECNDQWLKVISNDCMSDTEREAIYQEAHFNLLFSFDNSENGFYEGFGLTVLESGKYGTPSIVSNCGGLVESVHHQKTGLVLSLDHLHFPILDDENYVFLIANYTELRKETFFHTTHSHPLSLQEKFLTRLLDGNA